MQSNKIFKNIITSSLPTHSGLAFATEHKGRCPTFRNKLILNMQRNVAFGVEIKVHM